MLSPIILISSCFLDAMLMLSFVQISLEVSSTSTSTFPRVPIVPPLLSLQMVTLMRYTIIKTAATLVLLKQCGEFSNSLYTAALSWYDLPSPSLPTSSDLQPHQPPLCHFCLQSAPTPMCTCATCMT